MIRRLWGSQQRWWIVLLAAGLAVRLGYVGSQSAVDPTFARPMLDGAYYLDWARALASGGPGPAGAYYLAPLYPFALALFVRVFGEAFGLLYVLQQVASVATAGLLGLAAARLIDERSGWWTALLLLLYHPPAFFASAPVGETLSLLLLAWALWATTGEGPRRAGMAGVAVGLASLARPNLLLVPAAWAAGHTLGRRPARLAWLCAGLLIVIVPVAARNYVRSGHLVPVSSNAGITLYHGNGPGATGIFTRPAGFSLGRAGDIAQQREEATRRASGAAGTPLDPVEADRWWGGRALGTRLDDPSGTLRLGLRRLTLALSNAELSLDYAPSIDADPWRWLMPLPFAFILGLAAAGLYARGIAGSGGWAVWSTVAACAATPLLFYVSSRYRLPMAAILCVPAGVGLRSLVSARGGPQAGRGTAAIVGAVFAVVSLAMPTGGLQAVSEAGALSNRAGLWKQAGRLDRAQADLEAALALDPDSVPALYNHAVVLTAMGRREEAERGYRRVLELSPGNPVASGNLGSMLNADGRAGEALPILRRCLRSDPANRTCWTNLILAHTALGQHEQAREAARSAARYGVQPILE